MSKYSKIERYDGAHLIVFYDPQKVEVEGETREEFAQHVLVPEVSKAAIAEAIIRTRFSISDEISLLRQKSSKKAEFNEYDAFADAAIATAEAIVKDQAEEEEKKDEDEKKDGDGKEPVKEEEK